jgi:hypothetical protein
VHRDPLDPGLEVLLLLLGVGEVDLRLAPQALEVGQFSGTESFDSETGGCSLPPVTSPTHLVFDATYQPDRPGSGSFHIESCAAEVDPRIFELEGTFQLTTSTGVTLTGPVVGGFLEAEGLAGLNFTSTVTEGTRRFQHVAGTITLHGVWNFADPSGNAISGSLSGSLQH